MQTGKVTVENNALSDNKPGHDDDELKREHGDRELKVISVKPWTGSLLDENGNPIPGAYKAGSVMPVTGKGTSSTTKPSSSGKGSSQAETKPSSSAENASKNGQAINESSSLNVAEQIGILRDAAKGNKGYFGLGKATANEANSLGEAWVGSD
ncbi:hypothetical protein L2C91_00880 [Rosenbergiella epipactidis]|nr:hypothetical protein [Rosenbergiella epipactidis]